MQSIAFRTAPTTDPPQGADVTHADASGHQSPELPDAMRAAVYRGRRTITFEPDVPLPTPAPGELLLRVGIAGVCGTDTGEWAHGPHQHPTETRHPASGHLGPVIPGHEFSGTVVAIGDGVDEAWSGQRVASCGAVACGECGPCRRGESNLCPHYAGVGLHRDGALAGYVATPVDSCVSIEGTPLTMAEAALCQPMAIAVHCARRAGDVDGQTVLVLGVGGIGVFLTYALAESGSRVIAVDLDASRLELAREFGAERLVHAQGDAGDLDRIREAVGGDELRVLSEVTGAGVGLRTVLELAPKGARIVLVGMQKQPNEVDLRLVTLKEQSLIGTNALVRETDFPHAVDLVARRAGRWASIAPEILPLDRLVDDALLPMSEGRPPAIKTLIDPWADAPRRLYDDARPAG